MVETEGNLNTEVNNLVSNEGIKTSNNNVSSLIKKDKNIENLAQELIRILTQNLPSLKLQFKSSVSSLYCCQAFLTYLEHQI